MKTNSLTFKFCAALLFTLQAGCASILSQNPTVRNEAVTASNSEQPRQQEQVKRQADGKQPISRAEAIAIAESSARTAQVSNTSKVVACERRTLWVVIFDDGGPDYYISKDSGGILLVETLPQGLNNERDGGDKEVSQMEAIAIAKKDFLESDGEGANLYDAVACELSKTWRVFFEFKAAPAQSLATLPNADPPSYVIDKKTGKVLHKRCCN